MDNNLREAAETALGRLIEAVETVEALEPNSSDEEARVQPNDIDDSASDIEDDEEAPFDANTMSRSFERYRT